MGFGERFLSCPDLFPARRGGERWGEASLALAFAGGAYSLRHLEPRQVEILVARFGGFLAAPGPEAPVPMEVFQAPAEDFLPYPAGELYRIELECAPSLLRVAGRNFMARVELAPALAASLWLRDTGAGDVREGCENLLRVLAAYRTLEQGGALVHSAAIVRGGRALLFPGRSGAGKSTLSALAHAQGWQVLSDELNLVVPAAAGGYAVEQVPFAGDFGRAEPVGHGPFPLAAVVALRHAASEHLLDFEPGRTLAQLVAASPFVNADPWRRERLIEVVEGIAAGVPGRVLELRRNGSLELLEPLVESPALSAAVGGLG